jgi:cyclopropane fatty-acyl-phospholipid synthase-like methyltransferase
METFNAVVMMDVYEHIPRAKAPAFHEALRRLLDADATILMTTPSPLHQSSLATRHPDALQIVDETIGVEEVAELARAVQGTVTSFRYITVWHTNDYVHSVIERAPAYIRRKDSRNVTQKITDKVPTLWRRMINGRERRRRANYVSRQIGVRVS